MNELERLTSELRTTEARGDGTDVRLVLLEAMALESKLRALHERVAELAPESAGDGMIRALRDGDVAIGRLEAEWAGADLLELTMRMRELDDLLDVLVA